MSNVAEKLIIMADNTPAVAEAVNAAKTTASGTAIRVDDVLNVEHDVSVQLRSKNILDLSSLIGKTVTKNGGTIAVGSDGGITGSGTPTDFVGFDIPSIDLPKGDLTLSASGTFTNITVVISLYDETGNRLLYIAMNTANKQNTFNI